MDRGSRRSAGSATDCRPDRRRAVAQGNGWYGFALDVDPDEVLLELSPEDAERLKSLGYF